MFHALLRLPPGPRLAVLCALGAGLIGGIVGLVLGLRAYPPTAWFAIFEVGIPAALVGAVLGLVIGLCVRAHRGLE